MFSNNINVRVLCQQNSSAQTADRLGRFVFDLNLARTRLGRIFLQLNTVTDLRSTRFGCRTIVFRRQNPKISVSISTRNPRRLIGRVSNFKGVFIFCSFQSVARYSDQAHFSTRAKIRYTKASRQRSSQGGNVGSRPVRRVLALETLTRTIPKGTEGCISHEISRPYEPVCYLHSLPTIIFR